MHQTEFLQELFSLKGKRALCTGATSGLGKEIAIALAKAGADIILHGRNQSQLEKVQNEISKFSQSDISLFCLDLTVNSTLEKKISELTEQFQAIDIIVNAAGINFREKWEDVSIDSWQQTIDINLSIPFFLTRAIIPQMIKNKFGRIINIASLQSSRAFANSFPYGASKGGICQITRAMAEAWSRHEITANAIAPGFFSTKLTEKIFQNDALRQKNADQTAIGRNGELTDIHGVAVFLASHASSYITGQTIYLDGGFTAK